MENFKNYPHSELTGEIINAAYYVYNYFGYGFLESVYEKALAIRLMQTGFMVSRQEPITVYFEEEIVGEYRADLIINDTVVVELKAGEAIHPRHEVQLINYLKATEIEIGLVINFGEKLSFRRKIFSNAKKRGSNRIP